MRYLLDAHAIIWYLEDSPNMSQKARDIIDADENDISISTTSLWEIAIKVNLGKLKLTVSFNEFLEDVRSGDFDIFSIEDEHLKTLSELPYLHKDPFDRLLVATAIAKNITLITIDENIHKYDVPYLW